MNATLLRSAKQEAGPSVALVPGDTNMFYVLKILNMLTVIFLSFAVDLGSVVITRSRHVVEQ